MINETSIAVGDLIFGKLGESLVFAIRPKPVSKNESLDEKNYRLSRIIQRYNCGNESYKQRHKSEFIGARTELFQINQGMVYGIALKYSGHGIDIEDLVEDGLMGLWMASADVDPDKGEFYTHAYDHVHGQIRRTFSDKLRGNFNVPYHVCSSRNRINGIASMLKEELGREPLNEEVAEKFNEIYYPNNKKPRIDGTHVSALRLVEKTPGRVLNTNRDGDDYETLFTEDGNGFEIALLNDEVRKMLSFVESSFLNERERQVINSYYGLNGQEALENNSEISRRIGLSRELVRLAHKEALIKLRLKMDLEKRVA